MESFIELVEAQHLTGQHIQQVIRNYKKDGATRKYTIEYYQKILKLLKDDWMEFEEKDNQLRQHKDIQIGHEYFNSNYYDEIRNLVDQYSAECEERILNFRSVPMHEAKEHELQTSPMHKAEEQYVHAGLIRRIKAAIGSLKRILDELDHDTSDQPVQYFKVKLSSITNLWQRVEGLNQEVWDKLEDPAISGFDVDEYNQIEDKMQQQMVNLAIKIDQLERAINVEQPVVQEFRTQNSLPLPKVTIPKFSGDYLQWRQFFELFSQMIDKQQLPAVQKMWYLKANVSGEAERLINHLALTEEDYHSAWTLLQDRYNNKRVLVAALVDKLLNQPSGASTAASIKCLHDTTKECLLALTNLGVDTASWDPLLLHWLIKKIDRSTHIRFEQSIANPKELLKIDEFLAFLENQFQTIEAIGNKDKGPARTVSSVLSMDKNKGNCKKCNNGSHPLYHCKQFLQLSPSDRLNWVKHERLCYKCFKSDHTAKICNSRNCNKCNKKHNSLLHLSSELQHTTEDGSNATAKSGSATVAATQTIQKSGYVILATAKVQLVAPNGQNIECRALLDSGSQVNLITERLRKRLGCRKDTSTICIEGVGNKSKQAYKRIHLTLQSTTTNFSIPIEAFVLPKIVSNQPSQLLDNADWSIPNNIKLADPAFNKPGNVDLLIGAEFYHQLLTIGQISLGNNHPILQNTLLGWIVTGKLNNTQDFNATCGIFNIDDDSNTRELVERFWTIEEIGEEKSVMSAAEQYCENHFIQTTRRTADGKFMVKIPFIDEPTTLGESKKIAYNRFLALEHRLTKNPDIRLQYIDFMKEYSKLGHMTKINVDNIMSPHYFIPHHCVIRPSSTTTKLRVVFDASCKTSSGKSLNDIMHNGPTVQSELFSILVRFRAPKFVFTTDVQKMYRQILIHPSDRNLHLIFWREQSTDRIECYQLNTVTYGTRTAPYLATKCLQQLAVINKNQYPIGSQALKNNFYVDDCLAGSDNLNTAITMKEQLIIILKSGGLTLRKWCSNHPKLLQGIPDEDQEVNLDFDNDDKQHINTLGLTWLPKQDKLCIKTTLSENNKITKRTITSDLAKIFDPLGLLSPIIVKGKILLQQLWQLKLSWDEAVPLELHTTWTKYRIELLHLNNFTFPRHMFNKEVPKNIQIHVFTDASERAYGAAVYIRAIYEHGRGSVQLLCSKSRVAPLKKQTIPRLELCAALLGATLANRVTLDMGYQDKQVFFWTDSQIVLAWINSSSTQYNTFVAQRIAKIQEVSVAEQWRHVGSKDNPADLVSRGVTPLQFTKCVSWFNGPIFLHGNEACWPQTFSKALMTDTDEDKKRKHISSCIAVHQPDHDIIYKINHGNSFVKLRNVVAYILRFKNAVSTDKQDINLTPREIDKAVNTIVRNVQRSNFEQEIQYLKKGQNVAPTSPLSSLCPFMDENGIIRVGGRLEASNLSYNAKHPMLLPYNDTITKLIMSRIHEENMHCGAQALLAHTRQQFWPIKGKITARSIVQHCVKCARAAPRLLTQVMGNLPATRVQPARPFFNAGVDYCGPFWVHYKVRGKRPQKAYLAIFCCFATKAVHLELVTDLTTDAFIGALKRFMSRRGRCQNLYSDNAKNFVGAKNQLDELREAIYGEKAQEEIRKTCTKRGINFQFIPPRAPHFGGLWEAAVKSAKHLLVRSVSTASLTYEEMETVVVEIEAILNSRPLTPLSNDPNDLAALTPGHFLIGEPLTTPPDSRVKETSSNLQTRWKLVTHLRQEFWERWSREYLNELQVRHKWKTPLPNDPIGTLVTIKEDNLPPLKWTLGRITSIYKGNDNMVRAANVKTENGLVKRAIHKLAPLPIEIEDIEAPPQSSTNACTLPEQQLKKKRRLCQFPNITTTMVILLLALPLICASTINITNFNNNAKLYFEGMGTVNRVVTEWNLIVYYQLEPIRSELIALYNGTIALNKLCMNLANDIECGSLNDHFSKAYAELQLENNLLNTKRKRRGAKDIVGNIANSLFGVLDSEYAKQMADTINAIHENEGHLVSLLKNNTSILDSTINILKEDHIKTKNEYHSLEQRITHIQKSTSNEFAEIHITLLVLALSIQLEIKVSNLQRIYSSILDVLTDSHHGHISPLLLSKRQLETEIENIYKHLPPQSHLPTTQPTELYQLMTSTGTVNEKYVIFNIKLPIIDDNNFNLFNIIPKPMKKNNAMMTIKTECPILAFNAHRDTFFTMDTEHLNSCQRMKNDRFLCSGIQSTYHKRSGKCACEIAMFSDQVDHNCTTTNPGYEAVWKELYQRNIWIYGTTTKIKLNAVCNSTINQIEINGSGLLHLPADCIIKQDWMTIQTQNAINTSINQSYTVTTITKMENKPKSSDVTSSEKKIQQDEIMEKLIHLQHLLASTDLEVLQPNKYAVHHFALQYAIISLIGLLIIYLLWKRLLKRCQRQKTFECDATVETAEIPMNLKATSQTRSDFDFSVRVE